MLVLSRKPDQQIVITDENGTEVVITILSVHGNKVKMGFEATKDKKILRKEMIGVE